MDIQAAVDAARIQPTTARVVTLDIERVKGRAEIEFFDLNDMKNRRIDHRTVTAWPRNICAAWRWYGQRRVEFAAEWDDTPWLQRVWDVYDKADVVVGHNIDQFDTKKLKAAWTMLGLRPPRPSKSVDTLKVARAQFGFESNTLDSLCKRFGLPGKVDHYDPLVAQAAVDGDKAARRRIARYNRGDVEQTEALYDAMRGWIPNHPHMGTVGEGKSCNQCASTELKLEPSTYRAVVIDYALYTCTRCGAHMRGGWHSRAANTRGVR